MTDVIYAALDDHVFLRHRAGACPLPGQCPHCDNGLLFCLRCEAEGHELAGLCPGVPQHKRPLVQQVIALGQRCAAWITGDPREAAVVETVPDAMRVLVATLEAAQASRNAEVKLLQERDSLRAQGGTSPV